MNVEREAAELSAELDARLAAWWKASFAELVAGGIDPERAADHMLAGACGQLAEIVGPRRLARVLHLLALRFWADADKIDAATVRGCAREAALKEDDAVAAARRERDNLVRAAIRTVVDVAAAPPQGMRVLDLALMFGGEAVRIADEFGGEQLVAILLRALDKAYYGGKAPKPPPEAAG